MRRLNFMTAVTAIAAAAILPFGAFAQSTPSVFKNGLVWRNIGPFRGGRVSAVSGAIGNPGLFYMGLPMGGVWRSTSGGTTWEPVFDAIKEVSSIGSVEVAPSNPDIVYVGTGDMVGGGGVCRGNGVYKSVDGGKTWKNVGLPNSAHIPSMLIDPKDPNIVFAACMGEGREKVDARGLFRTSDGGKTWKRVLFVDDEIGIQKVAWAYDNPDVMIASTVRSYTGGAGRGSLIGGTGAGPGGQNGPITPSVRVFKSVDRGLTWKPVAGKGLPTMNGRTCVSIAMHTNSQRMFIVGNFGLYRSDDGGDSWQKMAASDRRVMNGQGGYNCGVYVDSQNPDIVYVVNTCCYRSLDGGKTFTGFKGAPGGDDPQQIWIDPENGKRILMGVDQGATVTYDGGMTWCSWYNQPSAQCYHITVDNQFPYWVYGSQQDSGTIGTASRGNYGAVTFLDWTPHPGYEFGSVAVDPLNPKISYAGGPNAGIIKTTFPSGQWIDISPSIDTRAGLRHVLNQPLIFSPTNPKELFAGYQFLMSTTDAGRHWKKLGGDLTVPKGTVTTPPSNAPANSRPTRPGAAAPSTAKPTTPAVKPPVTQNVVEEVDEDETEEEEMQRAFGGGSIECISPSTIDGNIIWVGTSNGQVRVTQDHGNTWDDVTIPDLPGGTRADISSIDASHHNKGEAYVAVDCHNQGDYKPYFYRTTDFGKSWTLITTGLPTNEISGSWARVLRADTVRAGLLFAGTESYVYVSLDNGDHWQSISLNLPNTSYRDMVIKNNDVVVGTFGRSFWVLDDISPLRQLAAENAAKASHLFKPADAIRVRRNVNDDTPFPPEMPHAINPPNGAIIYYTLTSKPSSDIVLEIKDSKGRVIHHYSSAKPKPLGDPPPPVPDWWIAPQEQLPAEIGLNRTNWNLRYDNPNAFSRSYEINANPGETTPTPEGPLVKPGVYFATLTVDGKSETQSFAITNDPRSPASAREVAAQVDRQVSVYDVVVNARSMFDKVSAFRKDVDALANETLPADVFTAVTNLQEKLSAITGNAGFGRRFGGGGPSANAADRIPTLAGLVSAGVAFLNMMDSGDQGPTEAMKTASDSLTKDFDTAMKNWSQFKAKDLADLNKLLVKNNHKPLPDIK